jgi:quinol monooxygenase YgiN
LRLKNSHNGFHNGKINYENFSEIDYIKKPVILLTIRVVAKSYVKPEKIQEFIVLCKRLIEESVKEEGCIDYGLYQELDNPGILTMLEEWRDKSNLDKHLNSNHFKELVPLLSEFLEKETEINMYKKKL